MSNEPDLTDYLAGHSEQRAFDSKTAIRLVLMECWLQTLERAHPYDYNLRSLHPEPYDAIQHLTNLIATLECAVPLPVAQLKLDLIRNIAEMALCSRDMVCEEMNLFRDTAQHFLKTGTGFDPLDYHDTDTCYVCGRDSGEVSVWDHSTLDHALTLHSFARRGDKDAVPSTDKASDEFFANLKSQQ